MRRKDREITDRDAMIAILNAADTCHLALFDGDFPYIVALNYGVSWEPGESYPMLYFHCAATGKKLDAIAANPKAAFFIDTGHEIVRGVRDCDWGMRYRSVAGQGIVSVVESRDERKRGLDLLMRHYSGQAEFSYDEINFSATAILRLNVSAISGKEKK